MASGSSSKQDQPRGQTRFLGAFTSFVLHTSQEGSMCCPCGNLLHCSTALTVLIVSPKPLFSTSTLNHLLRWSRLGIPDNLLLSTQEPVLGACKAFPAPGWATSSGCSYKASAPATHTWRHSLNLLQFISVSDIMPKIGHRMLNAIQWVAMKGGSLPFVYQLRPFQNNPGCH